ncbi:cell division protein SepF [Mycobacteroides abscessus subsp. abscessus]|nr:cell division protein SepF [Mycobacteroides abscessus subsp. abscessus]
MSTLHKVKAYFGMAPMDDYDDEYYDDVDAPAPRRAPVEDRRYPRRGERFADDAEYGYDEPGYRAGGPAGYADEDRFVSRHAPSREFDRPAPRLGRADGAAAPGGRSRPGLSPTPART